MMDWTEPARPEGADPRGFWECNCDCQACIMFGPHPFHGEGGDPIWIQPGQNDWPYRMDA